MVVAITDQHSVTGAALALRVSQPALSRRLSEFEDQIGLELFVRSRRGMVPTEAGERLAARARVALYEIDTIGDEIRRGILGHGRSGSALRTRDEATHAA